MSEKPDIPGKDDRDDAPPHFPEDPHVVTPSPETTPMEVHHHPHVEKKNFKEYLLEGLMIFLAVSMGFIAEGLREHIGDREKEKQFMESLSHDLSTDIENLERIQLRRAKRGPYLDSFMAILGRGDLLSQSRYLYQYNTITVRTAPSTFHPTDGTMEQLKNTGNLRLVIKNHVSDSIIAYDVGVRDVVRYQNSAAELLSEYRSVAQYVFDGAYLTQMLDSSINYHILTFNPPIRQNEEALYNIRYRLHTLMVHDRASKFVIDNILRKAKNLLQLIQKEYHLENEQIKK
ncbi:MAG: hypothetical protein V4539_00885 [Bacteroidota bacterium]